MSFSLIAKKLDFSTGGDQVVLLNEDLALQHGINPGDHIVISKNKKHEIICIAQTSANEIDKGHIGVYFDVYQKYPIKNDDVILVDLEPKVESVEYIKKKIKGNKLSEAEIKKIMQDIVDERLGLIERTYFLTTIYNPGYDDDELYYITKAMAETGTMTKFDGGIVADKHSIGGYAGKGITPLVVSIVSSFGIKMPNTSTRSITTPAGTTDILETITGISFERSELLRLMQQNNAFMVWGGDLDLAPADEELIRIERPMGIESYDKFIVSILAKKVAMGITHLLIDIPIGPDGKVTNDADLASIENKFKSIGSRFGIKIEVIDRHQKSIDGNGVGPMLEMREVLYILENNPLQSKQLAEDALRMAGMMLEMCEVAPSGHGLTMARDSLISGRAFEKFKKIISAQGGNPLISSNDLTPKSPSILFKSAIEGRVSRIDNKKVVELARILGCPLDKSAGMYLFKKPDDQISIGEPLVKVYSSSKDRLDLSISFMQHNNLFMLT